MPEDNEDQSESSRPFWSGTLTFGLVSIPVNLFPANRSSRVSLRMLGPTGKPLARRYYSENSGRDLENEDLIRGYEIKKDRFVEITDEELERLAPERSRDINLRRFVDEGSIPRLYSSVDTSSRPPVPTAPIICWQKRWHGPGAPASPHSSCAAKSTW